MVNKRKLLVNKAFAGGPTPIQRTSGFALTAPSASPYDQTMDAYKPASMVVSLAGTGLALGRAVRPNQWSKNLLVYLALFFTINEAWDPDDFSELVSLSTKTTATFAIFCIITGATYLINDVFDMERDRHHPRKRLRPIASGQLGVPTALGAAGALMAVGLIGGFVLETGFGWVALAYVATMSAYTLLLKEVILLDVFAISAGFVLRAVAGAVVLQVPISPWLYMCTGLGALFIALAKRRSELSLAEGDPADQRGTLERYSERILDQLITVTGASTVLAYSVYTFSATNLPDNHSMMLSIPFVVYGIFRYMYLVQHKDAGETPEEVLLTDGPLITSIVLWLATAAAALVLFRG